MKPAVGQRVFYKSKGNVYDYAAGTLVEARIESLVLRPGSNIVLPGNPVVLRVLPEDPEYSLVLTGILQGDAIGEWCEANDAPKEENALDDSQPLDRVEHIVRELKKHGIHIDPMAKEPELQADRIEGSPVPPADPEAAARVSYEKDRKIEKLQAQNDGLSTAFDNQVSEIRTLQDKVTEAQKDAGDLKMANADLHTRLHDQQLAIDALTSERNQLQDKVAELTSGVIDNVKQQS